MHRKCDGIYNVPGVKGLRWRLCRREGVDTDLQPRVTPQSYHFEASVVGNAAPTGEDVRAHSSRYNDDGDEVTFE